VNRSAPPSSLRRWVYFALGWIFFALGAAGAVLPVLPTTPFMLLALWAFSASSERFSRWLLHHRLFGPPLQRWRAERTISVRAKALSLGSMAASLLYVVLVVRPPWYASVAMAAALAGSATFVLSIPSRRQ
jgi:uncharacterized membrane protein YbaN (DUF454 family)